MNHRYVAVAAVLVVVLAPLATMPESAIQSDGDPDAFSSPSRDADEEGSPRLVEGDVPVVRIAASSWYECGQREAAFLRQSYGWYVQLLKQRYRRMIDACHDHAVRHLAFLHERCPDLYARLRGVADGMDMSLTEAAAWCLLLPRTMMHPDACTAAAIPGNVTADGEALLSWNLDLHYLFKTLFSRYVRPPPLVVCAVEGCYRYVQFGVFPFLFGFGLLNERQLAYAAAMVTVNDTGEGLTSLELNQLAMQRCTSVGEVTALYRDAERESGTGSPETAGGMTSSLNTLWVDGQGDALLIEYTHRFFAARYGLVAETNHHQLLDPRLTGAPVNDGSFTNTSSYVRLTRAYELLWQRSGSIDAAFLMHMFTSDHEKGYVAGRPDLWDICRHSLNTPDFPRDALSYMYGTVCSLVVEPSAYRIHYCPGHPCVVPYRTLELEDVLVPGA